MRPALREASVVATWGLPALAFSFYFDRPVVAVETSADLDRVMSGKPAVAIMTEGELARRQDRVPLEVLMSDPLPPPPDPPGREGGAETFLMPPGRPPQWGPCPQATPPPARP